MHEAYQRLTGGTGRWEGGPGFGVFLSGPSKTADIEQSLPGREPQFATDVVEFLQLRRGQVFIAVPVVGAGVHHPVVKKALIERV